MIQFFWTCDRCGAACVTPTGHPPAGWLTFSVIGVDACAGCLTTNDHAIVLRSELDCFDGSEGPG